MVLCLGVIQKVRMPLLKSMFSTKNAKRPYQNQHFVLKNAKALAKINIFVKKT